MIIRTDAPVIWELKEVCSQPAKEESANVVAKRPGEISALTKFKSEFGLKQARKLQDAQAEKLTSLQANKLTSW